MRWGVMRRRSTVPEVGLEPTRPCGHWILNPGGDRRNSQVGKALRAGRCDEAPVLVPGRFKGPEMPLSSNDVARVVNAWSELPESIKSAILVLVRASDGTNRDSSDVA